MEFDEILDLIGGWGLFQWKLLVIFMYSTFLTSYVGNSSILYQYTPDHWCKNPYENYTLTQVIPVDESTGKLSQCKMYNLSAIDFEADLNKTLWPQMGCSHGQDYNFTGYFTSVTTQFNWVCDEAWRPSFSQSMFFAGAICGTIIFGWISDHFGRFWTLMLSNINIMIMGIATPFCPDFISYTCLRFLTGLSFPTHYMIMYMLSMNIFAEFPYDAS